MRDRRPALLPLFALLLLSACSAKQAPLHAYATAYNQSLHSANDEQLLLNLVRLRYRENPMFLRPSSLSTSLRYGFEAELSGGLSLGSGSVSGGPAMSLTGGHSAAPTMSWTPLHGADFVTGYLQELRLDRLLLLHRAGWPVTRLLPVFVESVGELENDPSKAGGSTRSFERFNELIQLLAWLQRDGRLALRQSEEPAGALLSFDPSVNDATDLFDKGVKIDALIHLAEDGYLGGAEQAAVGSLQAEQPGVEKSGGLVLRKKNKSYWAYELRVTAAERAALEELLNDSVGKLFDLGSEGELAEIELRLSTEQEDRGDAYMLQTRSFGDALFYLAQGVEVPLGDLPVCVDNERADADDLPDYRVAAEACKNPQGGAVVTYRDQDCNCVDWSGAVNAGLLMVRSAKQRPKDAYVAIQYRGQWFYVSDLDRRSKDSMSLLHTVFSLQSGNTAAVQPLLTIPVR